MPPSFEEPLKNTTINLQKEAFGSSTDSFPQPARTLIGSTHRVASCRTSNAPYRWYRWNKGIRYVLLTCVSTYAVIGVLLGVSVFGSLRFPGIHPASWFVVDSLFFSLIFSAASIPLEYERRRWECNYRWATGKISGLLSMLPSIGAAGIAFTSLIAFIWFSSIGGLTVSVLVLLIFLLLVWLFLWLGFSMNFLTYDPPGIKLSWFGVTSSTLFCCLVVYGGDYRNIVREPTLYIHLSTLGSVGILLLLMIGLTSVRWYDMSEKIYNQSTKLRVICAASLISLMVGILIGWPLSKSSFWQIAVINWPDIGNLINEFWHDFLNIANGLGSSK